MTQIFSQSFRRMLVLITLPISQLLLPSVIDWADASVMEEDISFELNAVRFGFNESSRDITHEINPITAAAGLPKWIVNLVFSRLVRLNDVGEIEPDLALRWSVSEDRMEWVFELRPGVRWHDGGSVTAEDVVFTYRAMLDPTVQSPYRGSLESIREIDSLGPYRVRFGLKRPDPGLLYQLTQEIAPKHTSLGARSASHVHVSREKRREPVGSGPFRWGGISADGSVRLDANPDYFEGQPSVGHILVHRYPTPQGTWNAFMRQEIDLLLFMSPDEYDIVKKDSTFVAYAVKDPGQYMLAYRLDREPLSLPGVRKAIELSMDRWDLIRRVENGRATPSSGPFYTDARYDSEDQVGPSPSAIQEARKMIEDAGWEFQTADRHGMERRPLELRLSANLSDDRMRKITQWLRQRLSMIGIRLRAIDESRNPTGVAEADMRLIRMLSSPIDRNESVDYWHRTDKRLAASNKCCFDSCSLDQWIEAARVETDPTKREAFYQSIQNCINDNHAALFLYYPSVYHAANLRVDRTEKYCNVFMPGYRIKDFAIKKEVKGGDAHGDN